MLLVNGTGGSLISLVLTLLYYFRAGATEELDALRRFLPESARRSEDQAATDGHIS